MCVQSYMHHNMLFMNVDTFTVNLAWYLLLDPTSVAEVTSMCNFFHDD